MVTSKTDEQLHLRGDDVHMGFDFSSLSRALQAV